MKRSWIFFINPFIVATQNSYPAAQKIGNFTLNALLNASPSLAIAAAATLNGNFFNTLIAALQPAMDAYNQLYAV